MKGLHKKLILPLALALLYAEMRMTMASDARNVRAGCVFFQQQADSTIKWVWYWSRFLISAKCDYDKKQRKRHTNLWVVLLLRPYLEGTWLRIRPDHDPMKWILNVFDVYRRLRRWRLWCLSLTLMSFAESMWSAKRPTHFQDYVLSAKKRHI